MKRLADYWGRDLPVNVGQNNFDTIEYIYFRDANVAQAAEGTQQVSANIAGVSAVASQTNGASAELLASSGEMARQAEALSGEMEKLLNA